MKKSLIFFFLSVHFFCLGQIVDIPDANFKAALLSHNPIIDLNGDGEIQISEAISYNQEINVKNKNISNLVGIEEFIAITKLECNNNDLTNIDISSNVALTWFECRNNTLTSLDISELTELKIFNCNRNQISILDVDNNLKMEYLSIEDNDFEEIDVSKLVNLLHFSCSDNNIQELNLSNNLLMESLKCNGNELNEIDITDKVNLHVLECYGNNLTQVDVSKNLELWTLKCGNNIIDNLNLTNNLILSYLACNGTNISNLNISNNIALRFLYCQDNKLTNLDVENNIKLERISCNDNNIFDLDVSQNVELIYLDCRGNDLSSLDVSSNVELIELKSSSNDLESLDLTTNLALKSLDFSSNDLDEINLENNINLEDLSCGYNQLSNLNVIKNIHLTDLNCASNKLQNLELNYNTLLVGLKCHNNPDLSFINLKNGNNEEMKLQNISTSFNNLPSLIAVCVDDINNSLVTYIEEDVDHSITYVQNCSFTPDPANQIIGEISYDIYHDECTSSDIALPNLLLITTNDNDTFATVSQIDGSYTQYTSEGEFSTSVMSSLPSYFDVNSPSQSSNFVGFDLIDTVNFCIVANDDHNDLNIAIYPIAQAVPGFDASYNVVYNNVGTTILDGEIVLDFDGTKLTYINSDPIESSATSNSLTFAFTEMEPFESRVVKVNFLVAAPPIAELNDVLNFNLSIYPLSDDLTENDNTFRLNQVVIGAHDPNDITCLEGDKLSIEDKDNYLHYLIRFQNTGTYFATNVMVKNELDKKLDWTSFKLEETSHDKIVIFEEDETIMFVFENINLADSLNDEINSHGHISYKIKPKNNVAIGDVINNKADIFFDFNEPISTNIYETEIIQLTRVESINLPLFSCYPNPVTDILTINSTYNLEKIEVRNSLGRLVLVTDRTKIVSLRGLSQGIYFIKGIDEIGRTSVVKVNKY